MGILVLSSGLSKATQVEGSAKFLAPSESRAHLLSLLQPETRGGRVCL